MIHARLLRAHRSNTGFHEVTAPRKRWKMPSNGPEPETQIKPTFLHVSK